MWRSRIQSYFTRVSQIKEQLVAVEEEVENEEVVIATLNGLSGSWDSFIQGMCARRKWLLSEIFWEEHTQEDAQLIVREKKMGRSNYHYPKKIPQEMRNLKNSTLEETLIHISIWIINDEWRIWWCWYCFVMPLFIFSWCIMHDRMFALMTVYY